ncbi:glycosyltransferase [Parashewanella spongiae]|uniref:Glycosyltransferase n=1 Tax=Parashewanella spongiae TaxID=342950 RepID=A0A3A6U401_9GAMM|nr:glycosyltransferase family 4 protein [Parashewanella spongiae]MCL1077134.1 glycosyltransferase family 4 protein [Parashewanella spongiae]RJY18842.1 glycosyltransferase [Parashewanella spongiae]
MPNIYIIYRSMFDNTGKLTTIGGIENYILSLIDVFSEQGWGVHVVQPAATPFEIKSKNHYIHGIKTGFWKGNLKKVSLVRWVKQRNSIKKRKDIVIFATDSYAVSMPEYNTVAIQHGISWDKPRTQSCAPRQFFSSLLNQCKYLSYTGKSKTLVCVDHNFINWYRTWFNLKNNSMKVIYNFYENKISEKDFKDKWSIDASTSPLKVIIARRFVDYRGIKLIAPIIKEVLSEHRNVEFTFAGEGPLKPYLDALFADEPRVTLIKYAPKESFDIHQQHHIAIIPTLGSEGTSLSMIEAMSSGCAVISSNVGGLSNLIINGYNGQLVIPTSSELKSALMHCLLDLNFPKQLAYNGLQSISSACSKETWADNWVSVVKDLTTETL